MVAITTQEVRDFFKDSKAVLMGHKNKKKYSEIFHEYMAPIINEIIDDEKALKIMLDWGQFIWNKGVAEKFPDHAKSKDMEALFPLFWGTSVDQPLVLEFLDRKREMFKDDNFFIIMQKSLLDSNGRLAISIAVEVPV